MKTPDSPCYHRQRVGTNRLRVQTRVACGLYSQTALTLSRPPSGASRQRSGAISAETTGARRLVAETQSR
ncbi:hypothetical protein KCP77_23175 [Salmonella enterica subsp. enterica]|nr:hypothetical protein KCP77_23175 [Salmonella enterica subsp. enterica]